MKRGEDRGIGSILCLQRRLGDWSKHWRTESEALTQVNLEVGICGVEDIPTPHEGCRNTRRGKLSIRLTVVGAFVLGDELNRTDVKIHVGVGRLGDVHPITCASKINRATAIL